MWPMQACLLGPRGGGEERANLEEHSFPTHSPGNDLMVCQYHKRKIVLQLALDLNPILFLIPGFIYFLYIIYLGLNETLDIILF